MHFKDFHTFVILRHSVHIVGWPSYIPFVEPSNTKDLKIDLADRLLTLWRKEKVRFIKLSDEEVTAMYDAYKILHKDDLPSVRKVRSDIGCDRIPRGEATRGVFSRIVPLTPEFVNPEDE